MSQIPEDEVKACSRHFLLCNFRLPSTACVSKKLTYHYTIPGVIDCFSRLPTSERSPRPLMPITVSNYGHVQLPGLNQNRGQSQGPFPPKRSCYQQIQKVNQLLLACSKFIQGPSFRNRLRNFRTWRWITTIGPFRRDRTWRRVKDPDLHPERYL